MTTVTATDLADLTVTELLAAYRRREAVPSEALAAVLRRIELVDPAINALITCDRERAQTLAAASDRRWRDGTQRALDGVPFGVKDHIDVRGMPTLGAPQVGGTRAGPATESWTCVRRLEGAGAIAVAKLHIEERHGAPDPHLPRNPWDLEHGVGGSSSGPAAAVAAHELPFALGTDGLGSIRLPSSYVGIAGLKPTFGRIPLETASLVSVVGPMARDIADLALALGVMAGYDERDPDSGRVGVGDYAGAIGREVRGLRIGMPTSHFFNECDGEVRSATTRALELLTEQGCQVVDVSIGRTELIGILGALLLLVPRAAVPLEGELAVVPAAVKAFGATDYERALRARRLLQDEFARAFQRADAIVMPTTAGTATRLRDDLTVIDGKEHTYSSNGWASPVANVTGLPAITVCSGFARSGLPMGMQLVGRPYDEGTLLQLASAFTARTDFHRRRPAILADLSRPLAPRPEVDTSRWAIPGFYTLASSRVADPEMRSWVARVEAATRAPSPADAMADLLRDAVAPALAALAATPTAELQRVSVTSASRWLEDEGRRRLGPGHPQAIIL
jgi:aspartyl-tRNA(Asn)/glutamyl-tRNA(Gln) amidotransferase subunit A